ncbi:hypothetical protein BJV78DRAFT_1157476 [Lactifluus subvellereus]|nr:hypothetical protein BJV78DRAFT_1157476 [Lactifluus subvellereus]
MDGVMPVIVDRDSTPVIPQRRTNQDIIIDVDELDDEQDQRPSRRPRRAMPRDNTSRNPMAPDIIILDSDDASEAEAGPSTTRLSHPGLRLRSPPPPVQIIRSPPPVPPIPSRPRPRRPPHIFPRDVIRPNVEPFAFERSMATRPTSHPPGDAPPSRHHPVINLGGGFVSLNHQRQAELLQRQQAQDRARQRYFDRLRIARGIHQRHGFLSQTIGRIFPTWLFGDPTEDEMMDALAFSELAAAEPGPFDMGDDRAQYQRAPHEYRIAYTHPYPPAPGFTHNFESPSPVSVIDVDEEPGPSTKATGSFSSNKNNENLNTLVCARCLDPLVLGGSNMSEDERIRRRLWSLRCGHMLDGKCITELMKPQSASDPKPTGIETIGTESPSDRLQGQDSTRSHAVAQNLTLDSTEPLDARSPVRATKARGKLRTVERPLQSSQPNEAAGERAIFPEISSIRSRLRPRNNTGHVTYIASSSSTPTHPSAHPSSQRTPAPIRLTSPLAQIGPITHRTKRRSRGKGKQKAKEPLVLERHEWRCPVTLCERLHLSLHIESQGWVMDEAQGAIPIFA